MSMSQGLKPTELRVVGCSCVCPAVNTCKSILLVRLFPREESSNVPAWKSICQRSWSLLYSEAFGQSLLSVLASEALNP